MRQKPERLAAAIQRSIGEQLLRRLPELQLSVAYVQVSPDAGHATVWVTSLKEHELTLVQTALQSEHRRLRAGLSSHADIRRLPHLQFRYDDSWKIK